MVTFNKPSHFGVLTLASIIALNKANAHGQIKGVLANGIYNDGPNIYWDADPVNEQTATRKMYQAAGPSYVLPQDFSDNSQMACEGAAGAPKIINVSAGSDLRVDWVGATSELDGKPGTGNVPAGQNPWVHAMGTMASYIAKCTNDDCTTYDASQGSWVKLAMFGIDKSETISSGLRQTMKNKPEEYYPTPGTSGLWGMARFIEASSSWTVTIPKGLANGQYIIRQEVGAIHNPWNAQDDTSGTQLYIGCIQINVINGGNTKLPGGTRAGSLYATNGAFARYNVYEDNGMTFVDPGPVLWPSSYAKREEWRMKKVKRCMKH
ncbi:glycoside hydrolase [Lentinula lateritia]|nr:glycoside hydrolase [Lentinula lateritia]